MTVFHNLCRDYHEITAPPLDCARSGHLHTICSVVTKEKISSLRLRLPSSTILGQVFTQTGFDPRCRHNQQHLQLLRPQATPVHTSVPQVSRFCKLQDRYEHSHTDPEPAIRLAYVPHVPD